MIRIRQVKIKVDEDTDTNLLNKVTKKLNLKNNKILDYKISKKSIDARNKNEIYFIYEVDLTLENENIKLTNDILKIKEEKYIFPQKGGKLLKNRVVVVGSGPSGLFSGLILAKMGYRPLVIERGEQVEDRLKTVEAAVDVNKEQKTRLYKKACDRLITFDGLYGFVSIGY